MSIRNHRDDRARKKFHRNRMPAPTDAKLGTRVHDNDKYGIDDSEFDVEKCQCCREYYPMDELDYAGYCEHCNEEANDDVESEN